MTPRPTRAQMAVLDAMVAGAPLILYGNRGVTLGRIQSLWALRRGGFIVGGKWKQHDVGPQSREYTLTEAGRAAARAAKEGDDG